MIRKERVSLMSRLAIEEKNNTRDAFIMDHFWFNDYVTTELWKAFFAFTVAFAALAVLALVAYSDEWSYTYHLKDAEELILMCLNVYLCILPLAMLASLLFHILRYKEAHKKRYTVRQHLRRLDRLYDAEEKMRELREESEDDEKLDE